MLVNLWKTAAKAASRRAGARHSAIGALQTAQRQRNAVASSIRAIPTRIGRVQPFSAASNDGPSIWQLADRLRNVDVKGDREPVVEAIQAVQIKPGTTDERESQALDIIQSNVLDSLISLLEDERLSDFHVPTYLALIKLTAEPLISQEVLRLNAPGVIAKYLTHADPRLHAAACLTLGNLALEPTSETSLATGEVLEPLFKVLASPHEAIQRAAMTTVATIAGFPRGRQQLCEIDYIMALCDLLTGDHSDLLRGTAAFALGNVLSDHDSAAQDALRESGALPQLILLVSPAYPEDVCSSAAWAIHHGVHLNHENQSMVAEAGGLGLLFQHVFAENETLQTNALLALESTVAGHEANLQSCRDNRDAVELLEVLKENADIDDLNPTALRALDSLLQQIR